MIIREDFCRLTNLIYVAPERSNTDKYRILIDLIKCARNHRCINAVSVGINQVCEIMAGKRRMFHEKILGEKMGQRMESIHRTNSRTLSKYA